MGLIYEDMKILAKQVAAQLEERGFCVVFEGDLERWWPTDKIKGADREKQIQTFAKSRGWVVSIRNTDSGVIRAIFEEPHRIS